MGTLSVGRSWIVALILAASAIVAVLAAPLLVAERVDAQKAETTTATPAVAVLDLLNNSGFGGELLGRTAGDGLVLAMDESKQFSPVQRSDVEQAMGRLGFTQPMSRLAMSRLAEVLEVQYVATGTVDAVRFEQTRDGRVAVVDITVSLLDKDSGEFVNGAQIRRPSTPKPGYTADNTALVDEAITLATYEVVRTMISYKLPQATILSATPTDIYINSGSRSGLKPGMELVIMRFGQKVGRGRLTNVEPTHSTAHITANYRGITVGDSAVVVFAPGLAGNVQTLAKQQTRSKLSSALLGIGAVAGLYMVMFRHNPSDVPVTGIVASALTDPTGFGTAGILLTWNLPAHELQNLRLWEIWRNDQIRDVKEAPAGPSLFEGNTNFFIDDVSTPFMFRSAFLTIDPNSGRTTSLTGSTIVPPTPLPPETVGILGTSYRRQFYTIAPTPGVQYVYRVLAVVATLRFGGGTGGTGGTGGGAAIASLGRGMSALAGRAEEPVSAGVAPGGRAATSRAVAPARTWELRQSNFTVTPGIATAILPPPLVSPTLGETVLDPTAVRFALNSVDGATSYILQISRSPLFEPLSTKTFEVEDGLVAGGIELSLVVNVEQNFPPAPGGAPTALYWRAGAVNARDPVPPRTEPVIASTHPQDQGHVWSRPAFSSFFITSRSRAAAQSSDQRQLRSFRHLRPRP